ncbi:MAG: hypothetical protein IPP77_13005 [Bacteroidetes bacterium]|nr:hypothetical protein [Bacteroidota bacterium]
MKQNSDRGRWSILTSTLTLIICFISSYAFYQYLVLLFAEGLGLQANFTFNEVFLPMDPNEWDQAKATEVTLYPLAICFLLGTTIFFLIKNQRESWGRFQLGGFWTMVCLINIPISQILYAPLGAGDTKAVFYYGFARFAHENHISFAFQLILSIIGIIVVMYLGFHLCKQVLKFSHSYSFIEKRAGKNKMVMRIYVLPILMAALPLLSLGKDVATVRLAIMVFVLMIPVIGIFMRNARANYQVNFKKSGTGDSFPIIELIAAAGIWAFVYIYLA